MYDCCGCGEVKRKCTVLCQYCTGRKHRGVTILRKAEFSDGWLSGDEMRQIVLAEMAKHKLTIGVLAMQTESDHVALSAFLSGQRPVPDRIAKHFGFRRANAWVRL